MTGTRLALGIVSIGTAFIAAWLTFVLVAVVPTHSPASLPAWVGIDILAIGLVAIGAVWLVRSGRILAWILGSVGALAVGIGGWLIATWLVPHPGTDPEGYVLLIGGWMVANGFVALVATTRRSARTLAAA